MKHFLTIILILTCLWAKSQELAESLVSGGNKMVLTPKLGIQFGTIAKVEAEIFGGSSLHRMGYESDYFLKIKSVNGKIFNKNLVFKFNDETGTLANEDFALYELLYKKKTGSIEPVQLRRMQEKYVGKKLTLIIYETGSFLGTPRDNFKYGPPKQDFGFCFVHSLEVVSNLTADRKNSKK